MSQIGNVPEINEVKTTLQKLKLNKLVKEWEVPYENILTRLTAAIFFLTPINESKLDEIWKSLEVYEGLKFQLSDDKKLSQLEWKIEFNDQFEL